MQTIDAWQQAYEQAQEQAAADAEGRKRNVEAFTRALLTLGPDCVKLAASNHDGEILEGARLAANRWAKLHDAEMQLAREKELLRTRSQKRPTQMGDDRLGADVIATFQQRWEQQAEDSRKDLRALSEATRRERQELEALIAKKAR